MAFRGSITLAPERSCLPVNHKTSMERVAVYMFGKPAVERRVLSGKFDATLLPAEDSRPNHPCRVSMVFGLLRSFSPCDGNSSRSLVGELDRSTWRRAAERTDFISDQPVTVLAQKR